MKVLIIEDERRTADFLHKGLSESGFIVDLAATGPEGVHQARESRYDLILLDVMLPDLDGWKVMQAIREHTEAPVIFLTARDDVRDRLRGFELGADDYLVKPFAFAELLARMRRCLRRAVGREAEQLHVDGLDIDVLGRRVMRDGVRLDLTAREFALLHLLARRHGEVLSRSEIASQVWDVNFDTDTNVVDVAIRRLRVKVDEPFGHRLIHTVRGLGYVLDATRGHDA